MCSVVSDFVLGFLGWCNVMSLVESVVWFLGNLFSFLGELFGFVWLGWFIGEFILGLFFIGFVDLVRWE